MVHKSILNWSILVFAVIFTFSLGTYAQKTDCSKKTDTDVVLAIYEKIKVKYADQIKHINVRFSNGVLTIEGWATTKEVKKDIEKMAKKTNCVKQVVSTLTIGKGGGCGPGLKECGGICISEKEACNICLVDPLEPGCGATQEPKKGNR